MIGIFSGGLKRTMVFLFALIVLASVVTMGYMVFRSAKASLKEKTLQHLESVRSLKADHIEHYLQEEIAQLELLAQGGDVKTAFEMLKGCASTNSAAAKFDPDSPDYKRIQAKIDPFFDNYVGESVHGALMLICKELGYVMYSTDTSQIGANVKQDKRGGDSLEKLWQYVLREERAIFSDYRKADGEIFIQLGVPVLRDDGGLNGVLVARLDVELISEIMRLRSGLGESGETYLVGDDMLMRTDSRFEEDAIMKRKVDTPAGRQALSGNTGSETYTDYRGVEVLSSYAPLGLPSVFGTDHDWAIIADIDTKEAYAAINELMKSSIEAGLIVLLLAILVAYLVSSAMVRPLTELTGQADKVAAGDLTVELADSERSDEIGALNNALRDMLQALRSQTVEVGDNVKMLATSVSELSSTSAELEANTSETSTSVTEIGTTIEEVRQTSQVARDKADSISEDSKNVLDTAEKGRAAVEESIVGMQSIKREVEQVAESVMNLSEQSKNIGEIIDAVTDIADQSNLLSVNAAIEASKAGGKYGEGFTVVAREIKSLANQSKNSTKQIRLILEDIQKATGSAVMSIERGSKAVEDGVKLVNKAGESIAAMAGNAEQTVDYTTQITASARQQSAGVDQVAEAMKNITEAVSQNNEGAKQLSAVSNSLQEMSEDMQKLVERFRV